MNMLQDKYTKEVRHKLKEELSIKNDQAIPRLKKIVVNIGAGDAKDNSNLLESLQANLAAISGQKPVVTKAKKSISAFKLTEGQSIGVVVTLRKERMYIFLEKLINAVLPKVRDFRGVSDRSFDSQGNYNLGLKEQMLFPEVDYIARNQSHAGDRNVDRSRGLQITITTSAKTKEEGKRLLELLGMPFTKS